MAISFDRVADIYDETRRMPEEVLGRVIETIMQEVDSPSPSLLEIGIGTGRISVPLTEKGVLVTGIDISEKMLMHLREKSASVTRPPFIVRGDITKLPFQAQKFDAVLAVHVLHLVDDERACLLEVRRVLRPGGRLLFGGEQRQLRQIEELLFKDESSAVQSELLEIYRRYGIKHADQNEVDRRISEMAVSLGATITELPPVEWDYEITGAEVISRVEGRVTSSLWNVPDEILKSLVRQLKSRLDERLGSLSASLKFRRAFRLISARFPK